MVEIRIKNKYMKTCVRGNTYFLEVGNRMRALHRTDLKKAIKTSNGKNANIEMKKQELISRCQASFITRRFKKAVEYTVEEKDKNPRSERKSSDNMPP